MSSYKRDYIFGKGKETEVYDKIKVFFKDDDVKPTQHRYDKYDFVGKNMYELKSRNNKYRDFKTTLLPKNKVVDDKVNQVFLFNFTDGLYYIRYDKDTFDNKIECNYFRRRPRVDYNDKEELYYHIPIELLQLIE